ncbi:MerR family transcriptional regulator [Streptomyces antioxidans]|uniref:MerR family transcriptional regulator n=1 Tax=Streptomyces antioxidans TaxID=1507734 RepID=A0A1V4CXR9_9ACTN|nr:MerR family transcriptional regulator [Streptomyces antioxidans]OPF72943.1 MerR family transcriptional regulator [Streptomyces antioxidans]
MTELAEKAGITVRTLRFYRERKLLPPPRREGRIAWYDDHHLARLRTIAALLDRGHTLGGIAELLAAFESGRRDVGELLGLPGAASWPAETPVRLRPEALADYFHGEVTPENLSTSLDLGYLAVDGDEIVHLSRRLLDVSHALVEQGVPLAAVLGAAREVREHVEAIAETFVTLLRAHVLADAVERGEDVGETVERLRPLATSAVDAELTMAMNRRMQAELDEAPPRGGASEDQ